MPMEDVDVASGHAEAMDVFEGEGAGGAGSPIPEALLATGLDGGGEVGGFDGIDVDGALGVGLAAEDGVGGEGHGGLKKVC